VEGEIMILQLKVSLKGATPPVWRRFLVGGEMTFHQLHEILQVAFDWLDFNLHSFDIHQTRKKRLTNPITIGLTDHDDPKDYDYDESIEKIGDWLVMEKDRSVYTYNFFEFWELEILTEKVLPAEEQNLYPYCVKAVRVAPGDISKDSFEKVEEADSKVLTQELNDALHSFLKKVEA
jgi:hypothetical protein